MNAEAVDADEKSDVTTPIGVQFKSLHKARACNLRGGTKVAPHR